MKKLLIILGGIVVIAVVVGVILFNGNKDKIEGMQPEIRDVSLHWGEVTPVTTEILGTVIIYNPNSISIPVTKISCDIDMDGIRMGKGETVGLNIEKNSEFPVQFVAAFDNPKFGSVWAEHIARDEVSEVTVKLGIDVDLGVGTVTIPYRINQQVVTDLLQTLKNVEPVEVEKNVKVPLIGEKTIFEASLDALSGNWGEATSETSKIKISATVTNNNPYPLLLPRVICTIESNGVTVAEGQTELLEIFNPGSTKDTDIEVTINSGLMDEWFVQHIKQNENSEFDIKVAMGFKLNEELSKLLKQDGLTITLWEGNQRVETNILGQIR